MEEVNSLRHLQQLGLRKESTLAGVEQPVVIAAFWLLASFNIIGHLCINYLMFQGHKMGLMGTTYPLLPQSGSKSMTINGQKDTAPT